MRILLDENLDWRLEKFLPGHEVKSVPRLGWSGLKNGRLLARAQEHFDVLITMGSSMASQQNLSKIELAIVALRARSNRLADTGIADAESSGLVTNVKNGKSGEGFSVVLSVPIRG